MFIFSLLKIKHVKPPLSSLQMVLSMEISDPHHDVLITQKQSKLPFPHFPPHSMAIFLEDPTVAGVKPLERAPYIPQHENGKGPELI